MKIAQVGTKHGHAEGKLLALRANPAVELAGVYEPDEDRRRALEAAGGAWAGLRWYRALDELLGDATVVAAASEGRNHESLAHTEALIAGGKHVWYDKPAGDDWPRWQAVVSAAERAGLVLQMGYMFRYHHGFRRIAEWARGGLLGTIFGVRAHMSTWIPLAERREIARHRGGILYDLGGHMADQVVWLLGRPERADGFLAEHEGGVAGFADTTAAVLSYAGALAVIDIAAIEAPPPARRFEVYGTAGSAIMEPFEPAGDIRLRLAEPRGGFPAGEQRVSVEAQPRQRLYELELEAFLAAVRGERPPDRSYAHELLVQETLLRAVGTIQGERSSP